VVGGASDEPRRETVDTGHRRITLVVTADLAGGGSPCTNPRSPVGKLSGPESLERSASAS
jgi:hypothetical protein